MIEMVQAESKMTSQKNAILLNFYSLQFILYLELMQ